MKTKYILFSLIFLICLFIYIYSLAPFYNSDDSPETSLACITLGVQHPPGYPLNTIFGKLFTQIPVGNKVFRVNLMSCFFNLLAGIFVFFITKKLCIAIDKNNKTIDFISFIAGFLYLFSSSAWLQASIAKGSIYSMNAFFTAVLTFLLLSFNENIKFFYLFSFLYGLSMGNHLSSMVAFLPAVIVYLLLNINKINFQLIIKGFLFFLFGTTIYIFVVIRDFTDPIYAWGHTRTLNDFIWLITRAQYAGIESKHTINDSLKLLSFYLKNITLNEFFYFIVLIIIPGIYLLFNKIKNNLIFLLIAYFSILISVISLATPPPNTEWLIKPYLVSSNIFLAILIAVSIFVLIQKYVIFRNLFYLFSFLIIIFTLIKNYPDYTNYYIGYDYSKNIVKSTTPGCIVIAEGDMNIGAILYETLINKVDFVPFISVVSLYDWYRNQIKRNFKNVNLPEKSNIENYLKEFIKINLDKDIFYTNVYNEEWIKGLNLIPSGMLLAINTTNNIFYISDNKLKLCSYRGLFDNKIKYDEFTKRLAIENYGMNYYRLANIFMLNKNYPAAFDFFKKGLLFYKNDAAMVNAGLCAYYLGNFNIAEKYWVMAIQTNPKSSMAYSNLAYIFILKKDYNKALEMVNKALYFDSQNTAALQIKNQLLNIYLETK